MSSALCAACGGEGGRVHFYLAGSLTDGPARTLTSDDCSFGESIRSLGDVDADGRDDLLLDTYDPHIGGAAPIRRLELVGSYSIAGAGDTDGDGLADLAVSGRAGVRVFRRGLPPAADADVVLVNDAPTFVTVISVGDVDHDGFADVAVVWPAERRTDIYRGGRAMDSVVDVTLAGSNDLVAAAGDFNGDGFDDVLVAGTRAATPGPASTSLEIYQGGLSMDAVPDLVLVQPQAAAPPAYAFSAGDLNGDGAADLVVDVGANAVVYFGGPGADGRPDLVLAGTLAAAGDLDGDGVSDLALSDRPSVDNGRVRVFLGGPAFDDIVDLELTGDSPRFGASLAYLRNYDGDDRALAIAEPGICLL